MSADNGAQERSTTGPAVRMFQINQDDLATLERTLPQLADALTTPTLNNRLRTQLRQVQRIISDVRWNYGPASSVGVIPCGNQDL